MDLKKWLSRKFLIIVWGSVFVPWFTTFLINKGVPADTVAQIVAAIAGFLGIGTGALAFVDAKTEAAKGNVESAKAAAKGASDVSVSVGGAK